MSPTLPSPMSTPSYSCCAVRIVRCAEKPSLREASCCSVEVVNGGEGLRRRCLRSIVSTLSSPAAPQALRSAASVARALLSFDEAELLDLAAGKFHQLEREGLLAVLALGVDGPVFLRHERGDLVFALADHAQRRALHAPGRQAAPHFLPQQRREIEAHQVVERAARLLRVDEIERQPARMLDRFADRILGDLVEHHAVRGLALELAAFLEDLVQVPGDRLALAVRVGRQHQRRRFLQRLGDGGDVLLVALDQPVLHREVVVGIDRAFLRHQVAHVPVGGEHFVVLAQVLLDRARLGGRFDDDQVLGHGCCSSFTSRFPKRKTADRPRVLPAAVTERSMRHLHRQFMHHVFHALAGRFLARLAGQHHQHDPLDLLEAQLLGVERQQTLDDDLALGRRQDAAAFERQQQTAAVGIESRALLVRVQPEGARRRRAGRDARAGRPDRPANRARARRWRRESRRLSRSRAMSARSACAGSSSNR